MRKDCELAKKSEIKLNDLMKLPLIVSRQGMTEDYPKWFSEKVDTLNITATFNLIYNAAVMVREGMGYALSFDHLVDTGADSDLCFRPLIPKLNTEIYVIWKKYQVFTPIASMLLEILKQEFE